MIRSFKGCDSYDPDFLGEDDKPDREDEFDATEWDAEDSDFDQSVDQDDEEFIRRNQVNLHEWL